MPREYFQSTLKASQDLCSNVRHLSFDTDKPGNFDHGPGQFIMIHFPNEDGIEINRSYSISTPPGEEEGFSLCVKRVERGRGSTLLHRLEPGEQIKTSGPFGRFALRDEDPENVILVATGTGIAPFRSMRDMLAEGLRKRNYWLLMGVRHTEELLYHDEWLALAEAHANFNYRPVVSRPDESWDGPVGYVDTFLPEFEELIQPGKITAYLCGVPQMIDSMRKIFMDRGLGRREIRTEKFASPPPPRRKKIEAIRAREAASDPSKK